MKGSIQCTQDRECYISNPLLPARAASTLGTFGRLVGAPSIGLFIVLPGCLRGSSLFASWVAESGEVVAESWEVSREDMGSTVGLSADADSPLRWLAGADSPALRARPAGAGSWPSGVFRKGMGLGAGGVLWRGSRLEGFERLYLTSDFLSPETVVRFLVAQSRISTLVQKQLFYPMGSVSHTVQTSYSSN